MLGLERLGAEGDLGHVDGVLGAARMRDRAHERLVRVADVAVDHLEMALVDRQVRGLAQGAAAVVERRARVGQLHEVAEVLDRRVAPAVVEVVDERRTVGRHEDHVRVADHDAALGVAGTLREAPGRRGLHQRAAHPALEADARALDVGAGRAEDLDRLGVVDDLDADFLQEGVGVVLDRLEALGGDHLDRWQLAGQVGQVLHRPREALGLSSRPAPAAGRAVRAPPWWSSASPYIAFRRWSRLTASGRARGPRRTRGSLGGVPRSRRSRGRGRPPRSARSPARSRRPGSRR